MAGIAHKAAMFFHLGNPSKRPRFRERAKERAPVLVTIFVGVAISAAGTWATAALRSDQAQPFTGSATTDERRICLDQDELQEDLEILTRQVGGRPAIMVYSVDQGWAIGRDGARLFPQGSLRRLWLGAALLEAADKKALAPAVARNLDELLRSTVRNDDIDVQEHVLSVLGGPAAMNRWLNSHNLDEIRIDRTVRTQPTGAGGAASASDRATPYGMANGLGELAAGQILAEGSTRLILKQFEAVPLEHGKEEQWAALQLRGTIAGSSDASAVALLNAPGGEQYTIVVVADGQGKAEKRRARLMAGTISALQTLSAC